MAVRQLALWLRPEEPAATELDALIARLAGAHGTEAFAAHLTLLAPAEREVDAAIASLAEVADQLTPLRVTFSHTRCEQVWRRSLYLDAVAEPALRRLRQVAAAAFGAPASPFEPHLSLQYSWLPIADKLRLADGLTLDLPMTVRFDRLALWHTEGELAGRWREVASRDLGGRRR